mmetsp:Transcript_6705/g.20378  ORF Transcript_6705/g.20378 Transcript_6705/m.20378 type:complete len:209 (-) Transcript_6705:182-808(-)
MSARAGCWSTPTAVLALRHAGVHVVRPASPRCSRHWCYWCCSRCWSRNATKWMMAAVRSIPQRWHASGQHGRETTKRWRRTKPRTRNWCAPPSMKKKKKSACCCEVCWRSCSSASSTCACSRCSPPNPLAWTGALRSPSSRRRRRWWTVALRRRRRWSRWTWRRAFFGRAFAAALVHAFCSRRRRERPLRKTASSGGCRRIRAGHVRA